jgi:RimJ/RimL family protein N-acetyltransferase
MFIRTERLFLRPPWPEDWAELYPAIADEGIVRNLARAPWPYTIDDAMAFVRLPQAPLLPRFLVTLPGAEGARLSGAVGLDARGDAVDLGYWIARAHWGQGYASEAVRAVLGLARTLGHRRVTASHFVDNPASGRVLAKAGFTCLGQGGLRESRGRVAPAETVAYAIALEAERPLAQAA